MNHNLKPCPFCGSKDLNVFSLWSEDYEGDAVECLTCHAQVPLIWWNRRVAWCDHTVEIQAGSRHV